MQKKEKELRSQFKYLDYARIIFLSAKTHQRVQQLFPLIQESFENSHKRVQTSVLMMFLLMLKQSIQQLRSMVDA